MSYLFLAVGEPLLQGEASGDAFGAALAGGHDLDGDGLADIVVGAPGHDTGGTDAGAIYVFLGTGAGPDADGGTRLDGPSAGATLGTALVFLADADGDGHADVAAGAPGADSVVVYLGSATGLDDDASSLAGTTGSDFGRALGAGDLDGDGLSDVLVGAPAGNSAAAFRGSASGVSTSAFATLDGTTSGDAFGSAVAAVPDLDGDGDDEWAVGAPGWAGSATTGTSYLFPGDSAAIDPVAQWQEPEGIDGEDEVGVQLVGGDFDGDGVGDLASVAAWSEAALVRLYLGGGSTLPPSPSGSLGTYSPPFPTYYDVVVTGLDDADGDGASELAYGVYANSAAAGCTCAETASVSYVDDPVTGTGTTLSAEMPVAFAPLGDTDGNGLADLALGLGGGAGAVSVRLGVTDADGDGTYADHGELVRDCDDTDSSRYPGALEVDGDGVDSDCDGADDRPAATHPTTCPVIADFDDLAAYKDGGCGFDPCPLDVADELLDAALADDCATAEAATYADADCVETAAARVACEGELEAGWSEARAWTLDEDEWGECLGTSVVTRGWHVTGRLGAPTASGVAGGSSAGASTDNEYGSRHTTNGTLQWDDGSLSVFEGERGSSSGFDALDALVRGSEWASAQFDTCAWSWSYTFDTYGSIRTYTLDDGTRSYLVTNLPDCLDSPLEGVYVATSGTARAFLDDETWAVLEGPEALDNDGDGWPAAYGDCDDDNPAVEPCATENGTDLVDEDCDGRFNYDGDGDGIDDAVDCDPADPAVGSESTWYPDADGDGYGEAGSSSTGKGCTGDPGTAPNRTDCDDTNPSVHPSTYDVPDDGVDQDCDGRDADIELADSGDPGATDTGTGDTGGGGEQRAAAGCGGADGGNGGCAGGVPVVLVAVALATGRRRRARR